MTEYFDKGIIERVGTCVQRPSGKWFADGWVFTNAKVGYQVDLDGTERLAGYTYEELAAIAAVSNDGTSQVDNPDPDA